MKIPHDGSRQNMEGQVFSRPWEYKQIRKIKRLQPYAITQLCTSSRFLLIGGVCSPCVCVCGCVYVIVGLRCA